MKRESVVRYFVLGFFLILFSVFSLRHFVLGGGVAASVDALCPFGGFETLFTYIATGGFVPRILMSSLVLAFGILVVTLIFRKGFCGYVCPFGAVQELLGKVVKKKVEFSDEVDLSLRYLKYAILAMILISTAYAGSLVFRGYDPFVTFFHFGKGIFWDVSADEFSEHLIPFVILLIVLLGSILIERFWCRYFCPLAAVMNIFSKFGFTRIVRNKKKCIDCGICDKKCPVKVDVSCVDYVGDVECINCNECVVQCPKKALEIKAFGRKYSGNWYIGLLVLGFFLIIVGAKVFGIWQSVPGVLLVGEDGKLDGASIKGWMSLREVSEGSGINVNHFIVDLGLPFDVDVDLSLKDLSREYDGFETSLVRDYVTNFEHVHSHEVEETCPWELENDYYPGQCGLYWDVDGNRICDLSE